MEGLLHIWWVWLSAALVLALVELMVPASVFLGFALGALAMAGVVAIGLITKPSVLLAVFAALSLVAWIVLKRVFRNQTTAARIVTHDINEN
jgi:membrane protein implicated in regulation of membrane protease activity